MSWIWILSLLLTGTLAVVFYPLFSRGGHGPLPQGVEGDPRAELEQQRELLLRQLKEWQWEGESNAALSVVRAGVERELADLLTRLDGLDLLPVSTQNVSGGGERASTDVAFGMVAVALVVILSGGLYLGLGTPVVGSGSMAAAAPSPAEQAIRTSVENLAQRLAQEPDNMSGWMRLARSRAVLGNVVGAMEAYTHVLARQSGNLDAVVGLAELQVQSGVEEQVAAGERALAAVLEQDPNRQEALWALGAVAARAGEVGRAIGLWQRLLTLLPQGSESWATVDQAIQEAKRQ